MDRTPRRRGPTDPERAAKIARATFAVVRESGIGGLTHRAVAAKAGVPLGSTTYHYSDRSALLEAAMVDAVSKEEKMIVRWSDGIDPTNVANRLSVYLADRTRSTSTRKNLLVEYELYLAAARAPQLKEISCRWDAVLRSALEQRVGEVTGRLLFAAYNGLVIESLINDRPLDQPTIERQLLSISSP